MVKDLLYKDYYFSLDKDTIYRNDYFDLKLSIYNYNNKLVKSYKVEYEKDYCYKILKTKIKTNNILWLFDKIDYEPSISKIFFDKLISQLKESGL